MNEPLPNLPPELKLAPPRIVAKGWRTRVARWTFLSLALLAPAGLCVGAYFAQQTLKALKDHGQTTTGRVVDKRPPKKKESPALVYEYEVAGAKYRVSETQSREVWAATNLGAETQVVYLPEKPGSAYTKDDFDAAGDTAPTAVALGIVALILFLIAAPFWFYIERKFGKLARLASDGLPVAALVTHVARFGAASHNQWVVKYQFTTPEEGSREGKSYVNGADLEHIGDLGATTIVLYEPGRESNYELYPTVAKQYRIVVDEFAGMLR